MSEVDSNKLTLVTCYYSEIMYDVHIQWIENLLLSTKINMVIFCSKKDLHIFQKYSDRIYLKLWVLEIDQFYMQKCKSMTKKYHILSNEKPFFLQKVIDKNPFDTYWFAWIDIGLIQNNSLVSFLMQNFKPERALSKLDPKRIYIQEIGSIQNFKACDQYGISLINKNKNISQRLTPLQSGFILGRYDMILDMKNKYEFLLERYLEFGGVIGKDSPIYANLVCNNPDLFSVFQFSEENWVNYYQNNIQLWFINYLIDKQT